MSLGPRFITRYIPDLIAGVVSATGVALAAAGYTFPVIFDWGEYVNVANNLADKDKDPTKPPKYPLVWLVMDFEEVMGKSLNTYTELPSFQLIIACPSAKDVPMSQRRDNTFLPILYPIYEELINQFSLSADFRRPSAQQINHTKIDRPAWGGQDSKGNSTMLLFNDNIDAIQIKNLKLGVMGKNCIPSSLTL